MQLSSLLCYEHCALPWFVLEKLKRRCFALCTTAQKHEEEEMVFGLKGATRVMSHLDRLQENLNDKADHCGSNHNSDFQTHQTPTDT